MKYIDRWGNASRYQLCGLGNWQFSLVCGALLVVLELFQVFCQLLQVCTAYRELSGLEKEKGTPSGSASSSRKVTSNFFTQWFLLVLSSHV